MANVSKSAGNGSASGSALHAIPAVFPHLSPVDQQRQLGDLMERIHELGRLLLKVGIDLVAESPDGDDLLPLTCRYLSEQVCFLSSVGMQVHTGLATRQGCDVWVLPLSCDTRPQANESAAA